MGENVKFAAQMEAEVLAGLRAHAKETHRTLASVLTEAAAQYLDRARVRPAFRDAAEEVMHDHRELLERLAR